MVVRAAVAEISSAEIFLFPLEDAFFGVEKPSRKERLEGDMMPVERRGESANPVMLLVRLRGVTFPITSRGRLSAHRKVSDDLDLGFEIAPAATVAATAMVLIGARRAVRGPGLA